MANKLWFEPLALGDLESMSAGGSGAYAGGVPTAKSELQRRGSYPSGADMAGGAVGGYMAATDHAAQTFAGPAGVGLGYQVTRAATGAVVGGAIDAYQQKDDIHNAWDAATVAVKNGVVVGIGVVQPEAAVAVDVFAGGVIGHAVDSAFGTHIYDDDYAATKDAWRGMADKALETKPSFYNGPVLGDGLREGVISPVDVHELGANGAAALARARYDVQNEGAYPDETTHAWGAAHANAHAAGPRADHVSPLGDSHPSEESRGLGAHYNNTHASGGSYPSEESRGLGAHYNNSHPASTTDHGNQPGHQNGYGDHGGMGATVSNSASHGNSGGSASQGSSGGHSSSSATGGFGGSVGFGGGGGGYADHGGDGGARGSATASHDSGKSSGPGGIGHM